MSELLRWRLVLGNCAGRLADGGAAPALIGTYGRMDRALEYLYGREYQGRGLRREVAPGSLDPSQITLVTWLGEVLNFAERREL